MDNTKIAESMKTSLENFLAEFNNKLHSDEELDAFAKVYKDSLDLIFEKTGIMYCPKCIIRMKCVAVDRVTGKQFSCPQCQNFCSRGGINNR